MGRPQHRVTNNSSEPLSRRPLEDSDVVVVVVCPLWAPCCWTSIVVRFHSRGGREDEQARQSGAVIVLLEFEFFQDIVIFRDVLL